MLQAHNIGVRFLRRHGKSPLRNLFDGLMRRTEDKAKYLWALRNVSFRVEEGEIVGIIGRNGAGKSTLFLVLSRILDTDEGHLEVRGKISTLLTISAGFRGDLTGRENLYLSASLLGLRKREIAGAEDSIAAFAELEDFMDEPVKTYSSGMRARLGFATAVHVNPDILLMDEVLSVGDESFRAKSQARIRTLLESARAILIVSHNMAFVREQCSRVIWVEEGRIRENGDPADVVKHYIEFSREIRQRIDERARQLEEARVENGKQQAD